MTELAEFSRGTDGAMLQELAPDRTPDEVRAETTTEIRVSPDCRTLDRR